MLRFVVTRIFWSLLTLFVVVSFVFFLARLSGDPVRLMMPDQATQADLEAMREALGFNRPVLTQYLDYIYNAIQGDLGLSLRHGQPAIQLILERLPATLQLAASAFLVGFVFALGLAVLGEITGNKRLRNGLLWAATIRQAIPPYLFGVLMIMLLSVNLALLPSMGRTSLASFAIPILTIATYEVALYLRLLNASFDETRTADWVTTALAKGVSRRRVVLCHQLPNALLPVITVAGINLGVLVGGIVVLEIVFNWPGIGRLIVQGVVQRDYPVVQAGVVVTATVFIVINLIVDVLYRVLDPRVRLS